MRKRIALLGLGIILTAAAFAQQDDTTQYVMPGRSNSREQQQKPYVIMISIDGFRYDYAQKFNAQNLLRLSAGGVQAKSMQPAYPSLTFPNHYSLATGLYPSHHGLVDNIFYDPKRQKGYGDRNRATVEDSSWYGGTPLWVLAEKQRLLSASYFWVGSEAAVQGVRPSYYFRYNEKMSINRRIQQVVEWLRLPADRRPHLITFYFPEVDHAGHRFGPDSESTRRAVQFVDESIGRMVAAVAALQLPVNFIVVSDHGMMMADTTQRIKALDSLKLDDCKVTTGNEKIMIYNSHPERINELYGLFRSRARHYSVYRKQDTPERWRYGQEDRYGRIGDLLLVADPGYIFNTGLRVYPGHHGYDNGQQEMNAVFMAWGPAIKAHLTLDAFANVHVYPLVARLLGLTITEPIDGQAAVLEDVLKK